MVTGATTTLFRLATAQLVRLGDLEGEDAVMSVCKQFDLPAYKARRQAPATRPRRVQSYFGKV